MVWGQYPGRFGERSLGHGRHHGPALSALHLKSFLRGSGFRGSGLFGFRAWGFTAYLEQTTQVIGFQVSF